MEKQWCIFNVLRLSTTHNRYNASKSASNFKFPIIIHYIYGYQGQPPLCTPLHISTHLHAHLHTPPHTHLHTSMHPSAHPSMYLCAPPCKILIGEVLPPHHIPAFKNLINIKSWFFFPITSIHLHAHLCAPSCTSVQDSDWLGVPTTSNHIPAFKKI